MRRRTSLVSLFVSTLLLGLWFSPGEAQPGKIKKIADGVWFREGEREHGHCNNVIIEMDDYLIVVDANFPSGARAVQSDLKTLSSKPVKYVFDTHHHGDHAYGNPIWTEAGATTLAYVGVAEEMERYEPQRWQEASQDRKDVGDLGLATAERPRKTFSKSPFVLEDETRRVEFHFFGWAHTRGDGFVYLPAEKILCTGDAVTNGPYNYTGDGNGVNWPKVIDEAKKLDVERILPGHGGPGGPELFEGQQQFFRELHAEVQGALDRDKKLEDFLERGPDGEPESTSIQLSSAVSNWVGPNLPAQVLVAYKEITQGKPHGEILGGK